MNGSLEERLYAAHDANWNVSSIINTSATVQERYVYDPFGTPSFKDASYGGRGSSSFAWTVLHQGGRQSGQSGLYQFRNRELSASLGRWNRIDPIGFTGGEKNLYCALANTPLVVTDCLGLKVTCTGLGFGFTFGMGGSLTWADCEDECGNWAYVWLPNANIGIGISAGVQGIEAPGCLGPWLNANTWDVTGSLLFFQGGFYAGGGVAGADGGFVVGPPTMKGGLTAGYTKTQVISSYTGHKCPCPHLKACAPFSKWDIFWSEIFR